ncbi:hypothetical protein [Levilactobacillus bambusae]|uniref:Uncharacterized protein n=1 Tax=Levilactobacillus bambusae TaxID=2024736 RepID=A0A2V1MXI5_9LACO|nr:hypothetical protein [Levilactobacillus bambusae]PWF99716.1 hypothetical protein DCM90_06560 [Levilactobacillus bambusae]
MEEIQLAPKRVIVGEYIIGLTDTQRKQKQQTSDDIVPVTKILTDTTAPAHVPVYVLTDGDIDYRTPELTIEHMDLPSQLDGLSLYMYRWIMAYRFLFAHPEVEEAVFVDLGDVQMLRSPFGQFEDDTIYFGDELTDIDIGIVFDYSDMIPKPALTFLRENKTVQLLNPGVIAGKRAVLLEYLGIVTNYITQQTWNKHEHYGTGMRDLEMGLINYVAYNYFATRLKHGMQVSTVFFLNRKNETSWFKHK